MNQVRRGVPVIASVLWMVGMSCSQRGEDVVERAGGYRSLPPLCLPCVPARGLAIATRAQFDEVLTELVEACGESTEANDWRQRVENAGVDLDSEALVIVWNISGPREWPPSRSRSPREAC